VIQALIPSNQVAARNATRFIELARTLSDRPKVLIIGGGSKGEGTDELYADPALQLISFDIYASELTQFVADAHQIPLADATVDAVWIQAVLEHVLDPWRVVGEIRRVLKPGGIVYAETPFLQQVHEGAYDFTRFTESGHRWLFRQFEALDSGVVLGAASQLLWSIEHVVRGTFRSVKAGVAAKMMLFWLRYLDRLIPNAYASDAASAVYFLGRKSESAIGPKDMIAYYKGAHGRRQ
jgi:SAM-dependent methyltransferase